MITTIAFDISMLLTNKLITVGRKQLLQCKANDRGGSEFADTASCTFEYWHPEKTWKKWVFLDFNLKLADTLFPIMHNLLYIAREVVCRLLENIEDRLG